LQCNKNTDKRDRIFIYRKRESFQGKLIAPRNEKKKWTMKLQRGIGVTIYTSKLKLRWKKSILYISSISKYLSLAS
jgi:hypothetical protein